jgi:hypothetical protein
VIFASSEVDEKIVREDTARSSPSSMSLFLMPPLRTWATSAAILSWVTSSDDGPELPFVEFDLMTNEAGTNRTRSRTQQERAARRLPILKNQWVKTYSPFISSRVCLGVLSDRTLAAS